MDFAFSTQGIRIETPRLLLRPFCDADQNDFFAYASVPGVGEMAGWRHHETMDDTRRVLAHFIAEGDVFALESRETGRVIGSLGVHKYADDAGEYATLRIREIGYVLAKPAWGQGLMPEAVRAVIGYLFSSTPAQALSCGHFVENDRSRRVIEKCGFAFYRERMLDVKQLSRRIPEREYFIKKEDWERNVFDRRA